MLNNLNNLTKIANNKFRKNQIQRDLELSSMKHYMVRIKIEK